MRSKYECIICGKKQKEGNTYYTVEIGGYLVDELDSTDFYHKHLDCICCSRKCTKIWIQKYLQKSLKIKIVKGEVGD